MDLAISESKNVRVWKIIFVIINVTRETKLRYLEMYVSFVD